jgi:hypothetical protein
MEAKQMADQSLLETLHDLKAKAVAKRQRSVFNKPLINDKPHDPIMCPCDKCRASYKPMQLDERHFALDSTYGRGKD